MDKKRFTTLFLIVLADMIGGSAIIPILPVFVVGQFHASAFEATLVITAFYVAQVVAAPLLGKLSDRLGLCRTNKVSLRLSITNASWAFILSPLRTEAQPP